MTTIARMHIYICCPRACSALRDRARRTTRIITDPKPSELSCLKSPQTPNMPASHLSSTNVQTALSRPLLSLTAATAVTAAAACAAYFLGGGMNATVRNLLVVDHVSLVQLRSFPAVCDWLWHPVCARVGAGGSKLLSALRNSGCGAQPSRLALRAN